MTVPSRVLHVAEPPAGFLVRPPLIVDCSLISGLVFNEHWQARAAERITDRTLHAPHLLHLELANVAVKKCRQGFQEAAHNGLELFHSLSITLYPVRAADVVPIAIQYQLSAYDAAYLWLAALLKAPLATFDDKMAAAARTYLAGLS